MNGSEAVVIIGAVVAGVVFRRRAGHRSVWIPLAGGGAMALVFVVSWIISNVAFDL
ncbi:MAG: hypothetical protein H7248_02870 [Microbacteriaceae bacterium]|nr:hypothetical protein [Microbacteriaceae bacterium]